MKAIVKKLLRDFWLQKGKFILCVLAAVISAWGISSVFYTTLMSDRDFKENFSASNPVNFILTIKNPTADLLKKISEDKDINALERREVLPGKIKNTSGNWMPMMLSVTEDINKPRISKFEILNNKTADRNAILIENNSKGFLNKESDQEIIFGGNDTLKFANSGYVHDAGLPPSQMEGMVYLYTSISFFNKYLDTAKQHFLFTVKKENATGAQLKQTSDRIIKLIEDNGSAVTNIVIPPPGEHPHQNVVDGVSLLQKTFGGILSVLGIILLSLILLTWLYPQISDIGVMKTVGASANMVLYGYLVVLLFIITIGLAIGLPLGYQTAKFYNSFIAMLQNFQVVKRPLPLLSHLLVIVPSVIIPVLFCIVPLVKTAQTSIHNSLNKIFYTSHKTIFKITQGVLKTARTKYGVNNLFRSNQRTSLLLLLLILGIALYIGAGNLKYSINKDFDDYFKTSNYDMIVTLKDSFQNKLSVIEKLPFVEDIAYVKRKSVLFQSPQKSYKQNNALVILSPSYKINNDLLLKGELKKDCNNCIYISQRFEDDFKNISLGSNVEIEINKEKKTFIYSGIIKELTAGAQFYTFSNQPGTWYKELDIKIKDGFSPIDAGKILDDSLLYNDINTDRIINKRDGRQMLENHLKPTFVIIQAMGIFTIVIGLFGMLIVLNLSIKERVREMGIMKALGGSVGSISNLYGIEYLIINLIAIAGGVAAGYALTYLLCTTFGNSLVNVPFTAANNWKYIIVSLLLLLVIQTIIISMYSRMKVKKSSAALLNDVF